MARKAGLDRAVVAAVVGHETEGIQTGVYHGGPSAEMKRPAVEAVRLPAETKDRGEGPRAR